MNSMCFLFNPHCVLIGFLLRDEVTLNSYLSTHRLVQLSKLIKEISLCCQWPLRETHNCSSCVEKATVNYSVTDETLYNIIPPPQGQVPSQ